MPIDFRGGGLTFFLGKGGTTSFSNCNGGGIGMFVGGGGILLLYKFATPDVSFFITSSSIFEPTTIFVPGKTFAFSDATRLAPFMCSLPIKSSFLPGFFKVGTEPFRIAMYSSSAD